MPFLDPPDSIICTLTLEGRNLLARAKLGDVVYRALGWQLGRDGYLDFNPVKVKDFADVATEAVGYIEVLTNSFGYGDAIVLNGRIYAYSVLNPDWTPGIDIPTTVSNIVGKLQDSTDMAHYRQVFPDIDPANPNRIRITSLISGDIGNLFPIGVLQTAPHFLVTLMAGGISTALGDPAYPVPPLLGNFISPEGDTETPTTTSVSFLMRVPEGPIGMNAYGEVGIWVEVLDSRFAPEIGRRVLYAMGHFPIQSKSDRHIYVQRVIINF
jgi:hypothetical protein